MKRGAQITSTKKGKHIYFVSLLHMILILNRVNYDKWKFFMNPFAQFSQSYNFFCELQKSKYQKVVE